MIAPVGVHNPHHEKSETTMAESTTTAKHDVTVKFGYIELTGSLVEFTDCRSDRVGSELHECVA
ncbi:hypothetical protein ACFWY6_17210 [Streptomyces sp. NPDC059037]|uniref:hypothetical protein n=1 Tax=Streptomyces sp. NPDC059037 TaxID=3346710 RepID=UPI0036A64245